MIDTEIKLFTADEALKLGLQNAVKSNATKITASYSSNPLGFTFVPHNFVFVDNTGGLQAGRFLNESEFLKFVEQFGRDDK